jgi:hypothetical protein
MGTSLKDAKTFQAFMLLGRSPHVRPWWPDKYPDDNPPLAKCFAASLMYQSHKLQLRGTSYLNMLKNYAIIWTP